MTAIEALNELRQHWIDDNHLFDYKFFDIIENELNHTISIDTVINLLETLAEDSKQNGDGQGEYYYLSAIPYIKSYDS